MPGRWVGGPGSKACPLKDQYIEARILDEEGEDDGTVLLLMGQARWEGSCSETI